MWYRSTLPAKRLVANLTVDGGGVVYFPPAEGEWEYITGIFVPKAGEDKVKLALELTTFQTSLDPSQGIWIDDIRFAEVQ